MIANVTMHSLQGSITYHELEDGGHKYRIVRTVDRIRGFFRWKESEKFHVEMSVDRNANSILNWEVARGVWRDFAVPRFVLRYWLTYVRQISFVQNPGTEMRRPAVVWEDHPEYHAGRSPQRLVLGCDRSLTREILKEVTPTGQESWEKAELPINLLDRTVRTGFKGMPSEWVQKIVNDVYWHLEHEVMSRRDLH